jgi:hypothetical protein
MMAEIGDRGHRALASRRASAWSRFSSPVAPGETLQHPVRLVAVQAQGFGELVMRDLVLTIELDKERLFRLPAEVGPVAAKLVRDVYHKLPNPSVSCRRRKRLTGRAQSAESIRNSRREWRG